MEKKKSARKAKAKRRSSPNTGAMESLQKRLSTVQAKLRGKGRKKKLGEVAKDRGLGLLIGGGAALLHDEVEGKSDMVRGNPRAAGIGGTIILSAAELFTSGDVSDALGHGADVYSGVKVVAPWLQQRKIASGKGGVQGIDITPIVQAIQEKDPKLEVGVIEEELGALPVKLLMRLLKMFTQGESKSAMNELEGVLDEAEQLEGGEGLETGAFGERFRERRANRLARRAERREKRADKTAERAERAAIKAGADDPKALPPGQGDLSQVLQQLQSMNARMAALEQGTPIKYDSIEIIDE